MIVLAGRSALLSDFEVLTLFRDLEAKQKQPPAMATLDQAPGAPSAEDTKLSPPNNLMTVQYQTIQALSDGSRACSHQSPSNIRAFHTALRTQGFSVASSRTVADAESDLNGPSQIYLSTPRVAPDVALTKAEVLQLVNHAPQSEIELHTLVEELSVRFLPEQVTNLLSCVRTHLPCPIPSGETGEGADLADTNGFSGSGDLRPSLTTRTSVDMDAEEAALNENGEELLHEIAVRDGVDADDEDT